MPEKYLLHNLYKCSLTIITIISVNDLRLQISFALGFDISVKPCSAIYSYPIYEEENFGKIKMLPPTFWATLR